MNIILNGKTIIAVGKVLNLILLSMNTHVRSMVLIVPKDINSPLFKLYSLFLDQNEIGELKDRFLTPGMRYGDVKKELFEKFRKEFEKGEKPIIRNLLSKSPEFINNLLK